MADEKERKLTVVELFCGTKSISKEFAARGHKVFTVDNDAQHKPDICKDIMELSLSELPKNIHIIWASPPCQTFSVSSISKYWENSKPKNGGAITGRALLYKTLWLIDAIKPKYWFIENPRGMMRKEQLLIYLSNIKAYRHTVTYCQYGDKRQKPTDIWTNNKFWVPKPACSRNSSCHVPSPRGRNSGTQALKNAIERGIIPKMLCKEIVNICEV